MPTNLRVKSYTTYWNLRRQLRFGCLSLSHREALDVVDAFTFDERHEASPPVPYTLRIFPSIVGFNDRAVVEADFGGAAFSNVG